MEKVILAKSMAGHDRNHIYLVLKEENDLLYLCNGTTKTVDNPKKKKKMHVQLIKKLKDEVVQVINEIDDLDNSSVIKIIDVYKKELENRR